MAEKKRKYDLQYLYNSYKKHYKKVDMNKANSYNDMAMKLHGVDLRDRYHKKLDMDKANEYNDLAMKLHGVDLRDRYHKKIEKREKDTGMFGLGKVKRLRYG